MPSHCAVIEPVLPLDTLKVSVAPAVTSAVTGPGPASNTTSMSRSVPRMLPTAASVTAEPLVPAVLSGPCGSVNKSTVV